MPHEEWPKNHDQKVIYATKSYICYITIGSNKSEYAGGGRGGDLTFLRYRLFSCLFFAVQRVRKNNVMILPLHQKLKTLLGEVSYL